MRRLPAPGAIRAFALGGLVLVAGAPADVAARRTPVAALTQQADATPRDKPADTYARLCRNCHDAGLQLTRRTRTGWQDVLDQMVEKGATGSEEDFALVLQYLLRDYGKVNVNRATSSDIALVLGVSTADAATIVGHRDKHGDFKDFDTLVKVTGLEAAKLEGKRDAVLF